MDGATEVKFLTLKGRNENSAGRTAGEACESPDVSQPINRGGADCFGERHLRIRAGEALRATRLNLPGTLPRWGDVGAATAQRICFVVVHFKNFDEPGQFEHFARGAAEAEHGEVAFHIARIFQPLDEGGHAGAANVADLFEIEDDGRRFFVLEQIEQDFANLRRIVAGYVAGDV